MSRAAQAVSKIGSAGKTAAGAAASNASSAAGKGVDAVEGVADAAQKAAEKMAEAAPADAPSTGELAQRAGSAVKKTAEAAGTIAGAAAKQAGAEARKAADQGIGAMESAAQKAAEAAGAMSAMPGVDAPSAKELLTRLQNLSAKLGDIGMTVAENQVGKLEAKVDPNAPKIDNANSVVNLVKRFFTAIATLIGMKADAAMTKLESDPQYQAWLMKSQMAKAEKEYQGAVFAAAKAYHLKEIEIEQGKQESDKLAGQINTLLKPHANGDAPSAKDEAAALTLVNNKKAVDLGVIANLKALGVAKQALDAIVEQRATVIADATEKMIAVKAGLSDAEIGALKKNIATLESDFVQSLGEINERFKAEVAARVAGGEAAIDAANGNPAVAIAQAAQRANAISANDEVQKIKQQLAGK